MEGPQQPLCSSDCEEISIKECVGHTIWGCKFPEIFLGANCGKAPRQLAAQGWGWGLVGTPLLQGPVLHQHLSWAARQGSEDSGTLNSQCAMQHFSQYRCSLFPWLLGYKGPGVSLWLLGCCWPGESRHRVWAVSVPLSFTRAWLAWLRLFGHVSRREDGGKIRKDSVFF